MEFTEQQVEKMKLIGNEWKNYGKHRIYFNDFEGRLGLTVSFYKSGNVMSASFDGKRVSNGEAKSIMGRLAGLQLYFEVNSNDFVVRGGDLRSDEYSRIINSIIEDIESF